MRFRDRFYTPKTAKAILSWRILVAAGVIIALGLAGLGWLWAIAAGAAVYAATVLAAMPPRTARPVIDPFTIGEPWRQLVQGAQSAGRRLRETVAGVPHGPLRQRLEAIADQLEHGLADAWEIAKRGDEIDDTLRRLDPTALRSKLATIEARAAARPGPDHDAALESVRGQLASVDRLRQQSEATAASLRLAQTQLDALVARASEVRVGSVDTDAYAHDVEGLVLQLEALRQAAEETRTA